jgi:hypothetical protein
MVNMTQIATFSKLVGTIDFFNDALQDPHKLDPTCLQAIRTYLGDPNLTTLDRKDEEKMQCSLIELEKLRETVKPNPPSFTLIDKINRKLKNLERLIHNNPEETKKNPYIIVAKLQHCFADMLSVEPVESRKQRQQMYEARMLKTKFSKFPNKTQQSIRQRRVISALMNGALIDVMKYFREQKRNFNEHFTEKMLDTLIEIDKDPKHLVTDKMTKDIYDILLKTAEKCQLLLHVLICHLGYAIIGLGEESNEYADSLKVYIRNTQNPTLAGFNQTLASSSSALSSEQVNEFSLLFGIYCRYILSPRTKTAPIQVLYSVILHTTYSHGSARRVFDFHGTGLAGRQNRCPAHLCFDS